MKKKVITTLLSVGLTLSVTVSAFAGTLSINVNGVNRVFNNVENINGTTIVNGDELADRLLISYEYDATTNEIVVANSSTNIVMTLDSTDALVNGEKVTLPVAPTKNEDGTISLPLRFISETFGYTVTVDKVTNIIKVASDSPYISNFGTYDDVTDETKIYTYEEAVETAVKNSTDIDSALRKFEENAQSLENADDQFRTGVPGYSVNAAGEVIASDETVVTLITNRNSLIAAQALEDDQIEYLELVVEASVMSSLIALEKAKINYELQEETVELKLTEYNNAKTKHSLGMISDDDLETAKSTYDKALLSLDSTKTSIDTAKRNLNSAMGINLTNDIFVEFDTTINYSDFESLTEESLLSEVRKYSFTLKSAEVTYDTAIRSTSYLTSTDDYYTKYRTRDAAADTYENTKTSVEEKARDAYTSLQSLIDNDKTLRANRQDAINSYNSLQLQYDAGYVTKYNLEQAENAITQVESQILANELAYKQAMFAIDNPQSF